MDLDRVLKTVRRCTGLKFRVDQRPSVRGIIVKTMQHWDIEGIDVCIAAIEDRGELYDELVDELTVGETYFFREPKQFDFIRQRVVPDLRERRGDSVRLRGWSAACASGEEIFSLAILCDRLSQPVDLLGTDLSSAAINKARRAIYRDWSFRGEALDHVQGYCQPVDDGHQLTDAIRQRVRFRLLNLAALEFPDVASGIANMDLILCRNVLIYFHLDTIDAIGRRLFACLDPGGWLITASGDPSLSKAADFETIVTDFGTFYRRPDRTALVKFYGTSPDKADKKASGTPVPVIEIQQRMSMEPTQLLKAQVAYSRGDFDQVIQLTKASTTDVDATILLIRATSYRSDHEALQLSENAVLKHPLSVELHFLNAHLLLDDGQDDGALQAIQRALFLDRSSVMAQFLSGSIQARRRQWAESTRHFETVVRLCQSIPSQQVILYSKSETAVAIAASAESHLATIRARIAGQQ